MKSPKSPTDLAGPGSGRLQKLRAAGRRRLKHLRSREAVLAADLRHRFEFAAGNGMRQGARARALAARRLERVQLRREALEDLLRCLDCCPRVGRAAALWWRWRFLRGN